MRPPMWLKPGRRGLACVLTVWEWRGYLRSWVDEQPRGFIRREKMKFLTSCFFCFFPFLALSVVSHHSLDRKAPLPAPPTEAEPGSEAAPPPPHAPPPHQQPPPLPHRPPPPPPSNYIMSTTSSYMSGEGFQSLQSMMKTEGPSYAPMPPSYAPPIPPYHVYPPPAAPPPGPPPPPSNYPPPNLPPTYPPPGYNSYPPPPPRMPPGHVPPPGLGLPPAGYPPPPPVPPGQSQVPLPPPPGMPMNRGGWMR